MYKKKLEKNQKKKKQGKQTPKKQYTDQRKNINRMMHRRTG